ncbi:MAG: aldose 1-epimerase family protein [Anaerolineales bacterium]|jgi:hypothetical protein
MDLKYHGRNRQDLARYIGAMDQVAGIKLLEAADGLERGGRLLQVWTGSGLTFNVLAERALDISACQYKGVSLAWRSAIGDAHPAYYEAADTGWLRSFQGGMLVTCGLDTFGPPDREGDEELGQHGRLSNLPAREVSYHSAWVGDEYRLEIVGEVRQAKVFGENLVVRRRISTSLGSNKIHLEDTVTNESFSPHPHMILYHVNTGFPLLSEEAHLKFDVAATLPADEASKKGLGEWRIFQPPTPEFREQNFVHTPLADASGWAKAELENPGLKLGLRLAFDTATLPYLNEWKMMGEGLYVLAIEPMNCNPLGGRSVMRQKKALPYLEAGESRVYTLELEVVEYP